jgi:NTF2-related export protein 1/2
MMNKEIIDVSTRQGEMFVKDFYYVMYDSPQRVSIFGLYKDDSVIVWNGNVITGMNNIQQFFKQLPPTSHSIETLDCQPILIGPGNAMISVVVSGTVDYYMSNQQQQQYHFHQSFVLQQDLTSQAKKTYYIAHDCCRFTKKN